MKILVITPAGFQLGYLGCYGNAWINTPCLNAFAAESVVFDQHYSDCPNPLGAWRAWRTGHYSFPLVASESISLSLDSCDLLSMLRAANIPSFLITDLPDARLPNASSVWQKIHAVSAGKANERCWKEFRKAVSESIREIKSHEHGMLWLESNFLIPPWIVDESSWDNLSAEVDEDVSEESFEPLLDPPMELLGAADETTFLRLQRTYGAAV